MIQCSTNDFRKLIARLLLSLTTDSSAISDDRGSKHMNAYYLLWQQIDNSSACYTFCCYA